MRSSALRPCDERSTPSVIRKLYDEPNTRLGMQRSSLCTDV